MTKHTEQTTKVDFAKVDMTLEDVFEFMKGQGGDIHLVVHDLSNDFAPDPGYPGPWFHYDLYSEDPHKWLQVPIPWSLRVWWLGFGKNPNKLFGFLPFHFYWNTWSLTWYKGARYQGCGNSPFEVVESFKCQKYRDCGTTCGTECSIDNLLLAEVSKRKKQREALAEITRIGQELNLPDEPLKEKE